MLQNPLGEKLAQGETALGLWVTEPDMVELCAYMGFDWFGIDQMFTGADWSRTEQLIRTGEGAGITPVVRVQSNPWMGYDHRIVVDVSRVQGIGAQYILVSHSGKQEIEECARVSRDWHRKALHIHPFSSFGEWETEIPSIGQHTFVIPQAESKPALLDGLEEVLALPEIKIFFFAMTDASRELTDSNKPDWYNAQLWELVDGAVELGKKYDVTIAANTSYAYDMDEMARRVQRLHEHGVRMILIQGAPFLFQVAIGAFLADVKEKIG